MKYVSVEDGGCYGWLVVLASHIILMLMAGCQCSMGVFLVLFMDYFGEGVGKTVIAQSVQAGLMLFTGPLISILNNKYGTRPLVVIGGVLSSTGIFLSAFVSSVNALVITYGVIVGLAYGLVFGPGIVIVGRYFHKRHAFANGIVYAGYGVGIMIFPPLCQKLIDTYGWRGSLIVMAGINMHIVACAMILKKPTYNRCDEQNTTRDIEPWPATENEGVQPALVNKLHVDDTNALYGPATQQNGDHDITGCNDNDTSDDIKLMNITYTQRVKMLMHRMASDLSLYLFWKSWFRTMCLVVLLVAVSQLIIMVHLVNRAVSDGIAAIDSAFLLTIIGICELIGRATHGLLIDLTRFSPMFIAACSCVVCGISIILLLFANSNYVVYAIIAAVYGLFDGVFVPLVGAVSIKACIGREHVSSAFGWFLFHVGIGYTIGPPIAGWIYDYSLDYDMSFVFAGCIMILAALIIFVQIIYKEYQSKRSDKNCKNKFISNRDVQKYDYRDVYCETSV
ncbi:monocarboxylate transporter 12-like [Saccoglossus kowalevskii]|uniref:Monocarboxylate transporter 12-like n=1 Tax=Saccoglossus kowalevskii TaxID=10224 RepID=A0ABM0MW51_SACKO|nr:PREDICTED: monocarboxylate transporter 12-like [Saccoglossus kowalevskii]